MLWNGFLCKHLWQDNKVNQILIFLILNSLINFKKKCNSQEQSVL